MQVMQRFFTLICIFILCITTAYAAKFYRHLTAHPITVSLQANDTLIVDYDFSQKTGVHCLADDNKDIQADFVYKGRQKSAHLPLILQSDHVPDANDDGQEELADASGQVSFTINKDATDNKLYEVTCGFVTTK